MNLTKLQNHRKVVEQRHRDLDQKIQDMFVHPGIPDNKLTELKKQKLVLKQELEAIDHQLKELED